MTWLTHSHRLCPNMSFIPNGKTSPVSRGLKQLKTQLRRCCMMIQCMFPVCKTLYPPLHKGFTGHPHQQRNPCRRTRRLNTRGSSSSRAVCGLLPVDPWAPTIDSQNIASQLFSASLFPYLGFLYFITKSNSAPKLTLFGFYFLLAFVGATRGLANLLSHLRIGVIWVFQTLSVNMRSSQKVPAGIYAKVHYGTSLANVDWLHGGAESLLTLTNLFIVLGLREALRKIKKAKESKSEVVSDIKEEQSSV